MYLTKFHSIHFLAKTLIKRVWILIWQFTRQGGVVAEQIRLWTSMLREVPGSNPGPAVVLVPLGKALYPHCLLFQRRLEAVTLVLCIGEPYPMHVKEPTSLLETERVEIPVRWSDRQTYMKKGAWSCWPLVIHPRSLNFTLCVAYEWRQLGFYMPYEMKRVYAIKTHLHISKSEI